MRVGEIVPSALMQRQNHLFSNAAARVGIMNIIMYLGNEIPKATVSHDFWSLPTVSDKLKGWSDMSTWQGSCNQTMFSIMVPILSSHVEKCLKFSNT